MIMNLAGYAINLESLISQYTILVFAEMLPIFSVLLLTWVLPYLHKKKKHNGRKSERRARSEKENTRNILISQIVVSVLIISVGTFFVKSDVTTLSNLRKDLNENSVAVYEGSAYLRTGNPFLHADAAFDLIVDSSFINFENTEEIYQIDMSNTWEGLGDTSGEIYGKITYGENSKFILKIE